MTVNVQVLKCEPCEPSGDLPRSWEKIGMGKIGCWIDTSGVMS